MQAKKHKRFTKTTSCSCEKCVSQCYGKPGYFVPDQILLLEKLFTKSIIDIFKTKLVVEILNVSNTNIAAIRPAITLEETGRVYVFNTIIGKCIFLSDDKKCEIYKFRPWVCARSYHQNDINNIKPLSKMAVSSWNAPQHQWFVKDLLKRTLPTDR